VERGANIFAEILGIECSLEPPARGSEQSSGRGILQLVRRLPQDCQSLDFAVSPGNGSGASVAEAFGAVPVISSVTRATGYLGAATAAVELALGLLSVRQGLVPSFTAMQASDDGVVLDVANSTGIFFSRSWSGQTAAIVARACSSERKGFGVCAP
jgi:3-oxoacyl-(acyl-carrier-protein) synthase